MKKLFFDYITKEFNKKPIFIEKEIEYQIVSNFDEFYYCVYYNSSSYYIHLEEILVWLYSQIKK